MGFHAMNFIRYMSLVLFGLILGGTSWIWWRLPIQIVAPDIYNDYLVPENGSVSSIISFLWFFHGGYKAALIMAWDRNEVYFSSFRYRAKTFVLVPLLPILGWKHSWWKLPSVENMRGAL
ncbi:hypothetical protein IX92_26575 (plasmid) [Vibrio coralliilyticus]|uniref:Uncharacterized protein n=1 Tax=Vibrio coralliilyticus TaxID=190893 RepID=A0AAN0SHC0_9VIBR|nr:hypothetical protein IX92_26575 [Vibrio coralliilyticus]PAW02243.1 hypothetical protein CKJ79_16410 [Vibrio coralliilyticus]